MKIILYDIETTPDIGLFWDLWNNPGSYENILKERSIICGAWKELGKSEMNFVSVRDCKYRYKKDVYDDWHVVKKLKRELSKADILIAHNGDKYDMKFINGRALINGLPPNPPTLSVDTLKIARRNFRLNSNRLDYLGQVLGVGGKIRTEYKLWRDIANPWGDYASREMALDKMEKYNKQDVLLLERVYKKLVGWDKQVPNLALIEDKEEACPHCGEEDTLELCKKPYYTKTSMYPMWVCSSCWGFSRATKRSRGHGRRNV